MKFFHWFILFILVTQIGFCQNTVKLDSILKVVPTLMEDSSKVNTFNEISKEYRMNSPEKACLYSNKALELAQKLKWRKGIADANFNIGNSFYSKGDYPAAMTNWEKSLEIRKQIGDKKGICLIFQSISELNCRQGNFSKAQRYNLDALRIAEELKDKKSTMLCYSNASDMYLQESKFDMALYYNSKALEIAEHLHNDKAIVAISISFAGIHWNLGDLNKALNYSQKALKISEDLGNKSYVTNSLANIAIIYWSLSQKANSDGQMNLKKLYDSKKLEYSFKSLELAEEIGDMSQQAISSGNIGSFYISSKNYKEAARFIQKSLDLGFKLQDLYQVKLMYKAFSDLYSETDEPSKAFDYYKKYTAIKDSIYNIESEKTVSELQIKYDSEKKESENKELAQQNKILELSITNNKYLAIGLSTILFLIISTAFFIFRQSRIKARQENVRLEQKLLRTQMNPHFIFNSLTGIESFIYEHQPKEAGNYLSQFARLMRLILENSALEYISLDKEIETLNYYLSLQKLRLNDNLEYSIEVDESIKTEQIFIPPMLAQPFIENSIEHGFRGLKECGKVNISFKLLDNYLEIKIIDNGIGIVQAQQQKDLYKEYKSMAMQITHERLKFLNKSKKQKLIFSIREISEESKKKGTEVTFTIPV
jgi:tetratricopeptide (TPR) repeat protein